MGKYFDSSYLLSLVETAWTWLLVNVLTLQILLEVAVVAGLLPLGLLAALPFKRRLAGLLGPAAGEERFFSRLLRASTNIVSLVMVLLLLRVGQAAVVHFGYAGVFLGLATRLLAAWIIIRFVTALLQDSRWSRLIAGVVWIVAALHILELLDPSIALLDRLGVDLGGIRISVLVVLKGVIVLTVLLRLAMAASRILEKRIHTFQELTPSVQVLLSKALKATLLVIAVMVAMGSLGINLSAFAFVGGAIGFGVGFGLQKVVSNLVSGIILLMDKSIKPGDVIEVGNSYGRIESLGARYVSVLTRDGFEYLIPNEDLITHQVINWSFSNNLVRLKIGVGVSYDSDIHQVMDLMIRTAAAIPRVLERPAPSCRLNDFGDSSVDLELRLWISDPANGISNVRSDVRLAIWDAFKEHGIEIPFPQRDVHVK